MEKTRTRENQKMMCFWIMQKKREIFVAKFSRNVSAFLRACVAEALKNPNFFQSMIEKNNLDAWETSEEI
jgi:hypothetical protein